MNHSRRQRRHARRVSDTDYDRSGESALASVVDAVRVMEDQPRRGLNDDRMADLTPDDENDGAAPGDGDVGAGDGRSSRDSEFNGGSDTAYGSEDRDVGAMSRQEWQENRPPHWG
ncbi:hypothetical protein L3H50_04285 [Corynebacterium sp. MC-04]|uniref:Uncharacterized protein n=1 Tax=Corynebacterium parakroppenstedtii TaxID=2828363 RepID=A0ABS9HJE3_9CORY|nr:MULTISPECIES: hypothetical protein [Corynebacterium]MDU3198196.1 hypothetical protein [Corynebacterium kroppenstedtii]MBY0788922.1 hypothetical protein [Corynebacterium parakroppenstedtii]MBY0792985.1 hypothetical protein [Corynebacterium parakroppenstedtii]MBY0797773.1 hypothetical protein [Corynebacterium parakroppenstedtii]MCF6769489.1 hypothetical protein [Corynebacterium parakroppenstedtii]